MKNIKWIQKENFIMLKATISKDVTVMSIYMPFIIVAIFTKQKLHEIHGETDTTNNREL